VVFLILAALGVAVGLWTGGSLSNLRWLRPGWLWLLGAALVVRIVGYSPLGNYDWVRYAHVIADVAIVVWALLQIKVLPGVWLVALGTALNLVVITANSAHMPVDTSTGYAIAHPGGLYVAAGSSTHLNVLGDWIATPVWLGGVISPGDVIAALGVGVIGFAITRFSGSATKLDALRPGSQSGRE